MDANAEEEEFLSCMLFTSASFRVCDDTNNTLKLAELRHARKVLQGSATMGDGAVIDLLFRTKFVHILLL